MPTEPPSATHNSGPPPLGQPPSSAAHLASHIGYPPHPQNHPLQRPINPGQGHYAISNARNMSQMPAQPPAAPPSAQQPAQRPIPTTFYQVGPYPNNMTSYPQVPGQPFAMGDFIYSQQAAYMPPSMHHGHNPAAAAPPPPPQQQQQPPPVNPRTTGQFPSAPIPTPVPQRQHASSRVIPPQRKKIMRIVDPDTKEEVKIHKVEAHPSSPGSAPSTSSVKSASSPSPPVKIPPRKSRALDVVDPKDAASKAQSPSVPEEKKGTDGAGGAVGAGGEGDQAQNRASANVSNQPAAAHANSRTTNEDTVSTSNPNTSHAATQPRAAAPAATPAPADVADDNRDGPRIPPVSGPAQETESARPADAVSDAADAKPSARRPSSAAMSTATSAALSVESTADSSTPHGNGAESARDPKLSPPNDSTSPADMASKTTDTSAPSDGPSAVSNTKDGPADSADAVPEADEFPRFAEGERRVYPNDLLSAMKKLVGLKRASAFNNELGNLLKSAQRSQDMRSGRQSRSNSGPLGGDRGGRPFLNTPGGGFQMGGRGAPPPGGMNSGFDQIDLQRARSQAVPPSSKHAFNRDGDPRGTRSMGPPRGNRMDHGMRSHGSLDQFAPDIPLPKLKRSENGWKRDRDSDDAVTAKVKQVRSLLNKLTLEKFEKIFAQIVDIDISNFETLTGVVKEIFEKTLFEPKFSNMYAELCRRLDTAVQPILDKKEPSGKLNFKKILLNNCKDEFTRFANSSAEKDADGKDSAEPADEASNDATKEESEDKDKKEAEKEKDEEKEKARKEKAEAEASNAKKRMLANVRFISELFLKDLLREQIIHRNCIVKLLTLGIEKKEEDVLEALCKLISKTGAKLSENKEAIAHIDTYFRHLDHFSRDTTLPARIRFMVQDLIEQRHNNWKVRREEQKAKTISEIHKDIEKEERAKQEAAAAMKERRGRGQGGMHHRDRSGGSHSGRVHMTMAMNRAPSSNVSRSTASLEKYSSRASSGGASISGLSGIRLGPGGSKGAAGAGGLPSLRPNGGSRFNVLGAGSQPSDNRESSAPAASSDPRRMKGAKSMPMQRRMSKPEPETPQDKVLDPKELRNQVQRKLKYYWLEKDLADTLELIDKEFSEANHLAFVREALKQSFEAKIAEAEASQDVFKGLVGTVINPKYFVSAFTEMVALAPDMEMDNPRVLEFLGRYIGCCASTKKLGGMTSGPDLGLGFLKKPISEYTDKKKGCKLMVQVFSSTMTHMKSIISDEEERQQALVKAFEACDIDLASLMKSWNFMRGLNVLSDMLKDAGVSFLVPTLATEIALNDVINSPTLESVSDVLKKYGEAPSGSEAIALMRVVIRTALEWFLQTSPEVNLFQDTVCKALLEYYSGSIPEDVQMAVMLGVQDFYAKNGATIPPPPKGKSVVVALTALYDGDLIEEEALMAWKDDTDVSAKVDGKEKMLMDSIEFFTWLATADEE